MTRDPYPYDVLIAVGSNIEPTRYIPVALQRLSAAAELRSVSNFYWSKAYHPAPKRPHEKSPPFLNGACRIRTSLAPLPFKRDVLRRIEDQLGRTRSADKYAPREIDLDIALIRDVHIAAPDLTIPDPDIRHRPFLAIPLAELAPDWVVPPLNATLKEIAQSFNHPGLRLDTVFSARIRELFEP